jgi:hypothetical protein
VLQVEVLQDQLLCPSAQLLCSGSRDLCRSGSRDVLCSGSCLLRSQVLQDEVLQAQVLQSEVLQRKVPQVEVLQVQLLCSRSDLLCSGCRHLRRSGSGLCADLRCSRGFLLQVI